MPVQAKKKRSACCYRRRQGREGCGLPGTGLVAAVLRVGQEGPVPVWSGTLRWHMPVLSFSGLLLQANRDKLGGRYLALGSSLHISSQVDARISRAR